MNEKEQIKKIGLPRSAMADQARLWLIPFYNQLSSTQYGLYLFLHDQFNQLLVCQISTI